MARPTDEEQLEKLMSVLRENGGGMGTISLIDRLRWEDAEYWRLRDKLLGSGQVVRGRGRGGSIRLAKEITPDGEDASLVNPTPAGAPLPLSPKESDLYMPCKRILESKWREERGLQECHVEITLVSDDALYLRRARRRPCRDLVPDADDSRGYLSRVTAKLVIRPYHELHGEPER